MGKTRAISQIITGVNATDGAGVKLVRLFGGEVQAKAFDPFLMMDGFGSIDPSDYSKGFPWHPHRGIETITYLIAGSIEHKDSLGSIGVINSGDAQWMTAGSGIIHQEMPQATQRMLGIQLWLNLPKRHKMTTPRYGDILAHDIPVVQEGSTTVKVVAGEYRKITGAFTGAYVEPQFLDVELGKDSQWKLETQAQHTLFVYIVQGSASFAGSSNEVSHKHVVLFGTGDNLQVTAGTNGARILVFSAKPINEPIAWGGPVVMNTEAELNEAFAEMQAGTFIKTDQE